MLFTYLQILMSKKPICKKERKQNVDIQTSNFAITRSADDVPWTLIVKREPFFDILKNLCSFMCHVTMYLSGP